MAAGVNGVLVELAGGTQELAHDIAVHIAFGRPSYLQPRGRAGRRGRGRAGRPEAQTRNEGKPEQALPKIVEGKLNGWYKRVPGGVLLEQPYARDDKQTVAQVLGDAQVVRFAQASSAADGRRGTGCTAAAGRPAIPLARAALGWEPREPTAAVEAGRAQALG